VKNTAMPLTEVGMRPPVTKGRWKRREGGRGGRRDVGEGGSRRHCFRGEKEEEQ